MSRLCVAVPRTAFWSSDRGGAERVRKGGGGQMRSAGRWTCRSERSEDRNVHRPKRSSALRSLDERTAALPTERVRPVQWRQREAVIILQGVCSKAEGVAHTAQIMSRLCVAVPRTAFWSSDRGGAERVRKGGGGQMRSAGRWTCRSERSEDRNVHRPKRSSALRSLDERTAALPTERVRPVQQ